MPDEIPPAAPVEVKPAITPAPNHPTPLATTYTAAQLHDGIEKARIEERTKLQGTIDSLREQISTLKTQNDALRTAGTGNVDVSALIADITKKVEQAHANKIAELQRSIDDLTKQNRRAGLEKLKAQLIAENGGEDKLIMPLIRDGSEEELRESIKLASDTYQSTIAKFTGAQIPPAASVTETSTGPTQTQASPAPTVVPPPVIVPPTGTTVTIPGRTDGGETVADVSALRAMSPAEYRANRSRIQSEMKTRGVGFRNK